MSLTSGWKQSHHGQVQVCDEVTIILNGFASGDQQKSSVTGFTILIFVQDVIDIRHKIFNIKPASSRRLPSSWFLCRISLTSCTKTSSSNNLLAVGTYHHQDFCAGCHWNPAQKLTSGAKISRSPSKNTKKSSLNQKSKKIWARHGHLGGNVFKKQKKPTHRQCKPNFRFVQDEGGILHKIFFLRTTGSAWCDVTLNQW